MCCDTLSRKLVQAVALLIHIWENPGSNFACDIKYLVTSNLRRLLISSAPYFTNGLPGKKCYYPIHFTLCHWFFGENGFETFEVWKILYLEYILHPDFQFGKIWNKTGNVRTCITYHCGAFVQPLFQWKNNECFTTSVCVCVFVALGIQHAMHMGHIVILACLALLYFPPYLINGTIFEGMLLDKKCVLIFSITFVRNIFHSKTNWARYDRKCILEFTWNTLHSCPIFMKLEFSQRIFEKSLNIKFHAYASSGSRVMRRTDGRTDAQTDGKTDRHDEANSRF
jgi:hypothetical protein